MVLPLPWLRASLLGSLWAANEIVLGSFLHNLNVPFTGTILACIGISILSVGILLWRDSGVLWRAGVICALMKSISPSAVILGPMIGIMLEAFLFWMLTSLFRNHTIGILLGAAAAATTPILQKIAGILVTYGFDAAQLFVALVAVAAKSVRLQILGPGEIVLLFLAISAFMGITFAFMGMKVARRVVAEKVNFSAIPQRALQDGFLKAPLHQRFSLLLLFSHVLILAGGLLTITMVPLWMAGAVVLAYFGISLRRYPDLQRRFARPRLWIEITFVAGLAGLFLGGLSEQTPGWTMTGFLTGIQMALRALFVVVVFSSLSIELRNPRVIEWFLKRGLGTLSASLDVAFQALPTMAAVLAEQKKAILSPIRSLTHMVGTVCAMIEQYSESPTSSRPTVILLTGKQGSGKTTFLAALLNITRRKRIPIGGILSHVVYDGMERVGYDVEDLQTGERRLLCRSNEQNDGIRIGPFTFAPDGLDFGRAALLSFKQTAAQALVIDEVGPLELGGDGWAPAFDGVFVTGPPVVLVTVRPQIIEEVKKRWGLLTPVVWDVTTTTPEYAARMLRELIGKFQGTPTEALSV